jgi:tetratricopeptide (TPR) repeat protein
MKNLLTYFLFMMATICSADDTSYWATLKESLRMADSAYCMMTYQNLANCCDRIIRLYENDWLPWYYKAYACTHLGFMAGDESEKDLMYDVAQESLEAAIRINPDESENHVLQALICYGRMEINPMVRATVYYPRANAALEKAKELNPDNPRIYFLEGKSTLYKPDFLGGGIEAAIPILQKALECYTEFEAPYAVYPYWGKENTRALYDKCLEERTEKQPGD